MSIVQLSIIIVPFHIVSTVVANRWFLLVDKHWSDPILFPTGCFFVWLIRFLFPRNDTGLSQCDKTASIHSFRVALCGGMVRGDAGLFGLDQGGSGHCGLRRVVLCPVVDRSRGGPHPSQR